MQKIIYMVAVATLILSSCQTDNNVRKAINYDMIFYSNEQGAKPVAGEYAFFQMDILDDKKKVLQSYRSQSRLPSLKIPEAGSQVLLENPIPSALQQMSLNDSVGIIVPRDSIPDLDAGYEDLVHIEYILVLKEILSEEEYQERVVVERQKELERVEAVRADLPNIEALTAKTLSEYKAGGLSLKSTENGIQYVIHELGDGEMPAKDRMISAHYYGLLVSDGSTFDNSFQRGRPFTFRLGRGEVIKGWDEGFLSLPVGTKASLFIPSDLGYGAAGSPPAIPADSELYFYVEVKELFY